MLTRLKINNFTVFPQADLVFSPHLNVFIGENGAGKSHLLKLAYSVLATSAEEGHKPNAAPPTKTVWQTRLADKLIGVFRPEALGRLARRKRGLERCEVGCVFNNSALNIRFSFATQSKSEVAIEHLPETWLEKSPAFLPPHELLTIYPGFIPVYEGHYLEFEETWRDACLLLGAPSLRGPREKTVKTLLKPLEDAMGGSIVLDKNGRFYLKRPGQDTMEMPLVAEGLCKFGMVARLIATGSLLDQGYLFWDEPETNLNPKLIKLIAETILHLCRHGIQVFVATHSLFLLREFEILATRETFRKLAPCYFALDITDDGVVIQQGETTDSIGPLILLDEELEQSDRFLEEA